MKSPLRDRGSTSVEVVLLMFVVLGIGLFLGYVGRLNAAGVQVANTAQAAARAASLANDSTEAQAAMDAAVAGSSLANYCIGGPSAKLEAPSADWFGSTVTVTVRCTVKQQALAGVWVPGERTLAVADTQVVERFRS